MKKVLAVSDNGSNWEQLYLITQSFVNYQKIYVTEDYNYIVGRERTNYFLLPKLNSYNPFKIIQNYIECYNLIKKLNSDIVITNGSWVGLICLIFAKHQGSKTIWIDGLQYSENISVPGRFASWIVDTCITQWQHLSRAGKIKYLGCIL
jgi:UDP-N-acetylglucosamine:LPS N-acetylglucosamine transferase